MQLAAANTAADSTRLDITTDPAGTPGVEIRTATARDTLRVHSEHGNAIYATRNHTDTSRAAVSAYGTYLGVYAQINGTGAPAVMGQGVDPPGVCTSTTGDHLPRRPTNVGPSNHVPGPAKADRPANIVAGVPMILRAIAKLRLSADTQQP